MVETSGSERANKPTNGSADRSYSGSGTREGRAYTPREGGARPQSSFTGARGGANTGRPSGEGSHRPMTFQKKKFVYRKKECYYTKNRIPYVDYKDVTALKNFVGYSGQILANRFTGLKPIFQRKAAKAIKRARFMAMIPFVGEVKKANYRRDDSRSRYGSDASRADASAAVAATPAAEAASSTEAVVETPNVAATESSTTKNSNPQATSAENAE